MEKPGGDFLHGAPAVAEHEPLLAAVQPRDHGGGVVERADVIERDVGARWTCNGGCDDATMPAARAHEPAKKSRRLPNCRRKPDALQVVTRGLGHALKDRQQVPATIVSGEGVDLVDDHSSHPSEEALMVAAGRDEDDFDPLGRDEQAVGWLTHDLVACRRSDIAVP